MSIHSYKHEAGRQAYRDGNYSEAERLATESYAETGDIHSFVNMKVAQYALGKITKTELNSAVDWAESQHGSSSHFDSIRKRGY
jgi:hypothetical protein